LPDGSAFVDVPPDVALSAGPFSLQQHASVEGGQLTFERRIERRTQRVTSSSWPARGTRSTRTLPER